MTIVSQRILPLGLITIALVLTACGGGGGKKTTPPTSSLSSQQVSISSPATSSTPQVTSSSSSSLASLEPTASILFPPLNAFTEGSSVLVRGTAGDADGAIKSVNVNGVQAASNDGFATWSVNIPLATGLNSLSVTVTDDTGVTNQKPIEQKITHQVAQIRQAEQMAYDGKNNRALVVDNSYNDYLSSSIIAVDLETGAQTLFSDKDVGDITVDEAGNRALVLAAEGLIAIDLTTGQEKLIDVGTLEGSSEKLVLNRIEFDNLNSKLWALTSSGLVVVDLLTGIPTIVEDTVLKNEPVEMPYAEAMQFDPVNHRIVVASRGYSYLGLIGIDTITGDRKVISNQNTPNASNMFAFSGNVDVAVDSTNNRIFAADANHQVIYEVNASTGARIPLELTLDNTKSPINRPMSLFIDAKNRLIVLNSRVDSLIAVDLATKKTSLISEIHTNSLDVPLGGSQAIIYDSQSDKIFSGDYDSVISINAETGDRAMFKKRSVDSSRNYRGLAYNATKNILYYGEGYDRVVESLNLTSGERSVLTGIGIPNFLNIPHYYTALEIDEQRNQLIAIDGSTAAIYGVDLLTGERSIISDNKTPNTSNPLIYPIGIDFDAANNRLFVLDYSSKAIYQIDINTGARQLLTGPTIPNTDNSLVSPIAVAHDAINNRVIVADTGLRALVQVDLATGQRSIFSSNEAPDSAIPFSAPTWLEVDANKNVVYVSDRSSNKFLSVNLTTGKRTQLFSVDSPEQFIMDSKNNRAIITSESPGALYIYDFTQQKLSEYKMEPEFDSIEALEVDLVNDRIIVTDQDQKITALNKTDATVERLYDEPIANRARVISLDSATQTLFGLSDYKIYSKNLNVGESSVLVNFRNQATPYDVEYVLDIALDSSPNSVIMVGRNRKYQNMIWRLDTLGLSLETVFQDKTFSTEDERGMLDIVVDASKQRAYMVDNRRGSVEEIDLVDGSHKLLSDAKTPNTFNPILGVNSMTLDSKRNRLLISQYYVPGLLSIDLQTGERVYVSR